MMEPAMSSIATRSAFAAALVLSLAFFTRGSQAALFQNGELINVDFNGGPGSDTGDHRNTLGNTATGAAAVGAPGDVWNGIAGNSATNLALVNQTGAATSATLTFQSDSNWTTDISGGNAAGSPAPNQALMNEFIISFGNNPNPVSIGGLHPGDTLSLYTYTDDDCCSGRVTTFAVTDASGTHTQIMNNDHTSSTWVQNPGDGTQLGNYLLFSGLHPLPNGTLSFTFAGNEGDLNGLQLLVTRATPEPGSLVLIGLGAVGLVIAARRRCKV
jgi:hypothetical protein